MSIQFAKAEINRFYLEILERPAEEGGSNYWLSQYKDAGMSLNSIRSGVAYSQESINNVNNLYRSILHRESDPVGLHGWLGQLHNGQSLNFVRRGVALSTEASNTGRIVSGTDNSDNIVISGSKNDTILGSLGQDNLDGGDGFDTVNYQGTDYRVFLSQNNLIKIGLPGRDTLSNIEVVIANPNLANNQIGLLNSPSRISINANLSTANVQFLDTASSRILLKFSAYNFDDVGGANGNDTLTGDFQDNRFEGSGGNDIICGLGGNDTITGGTGGDMFVFQSREQGIDLISDFSYSQGDKIVIYKSGFGASSASQFSYNNTTGALDFQGKQFASLQPNLNLGLIPPSSYIDLVT
jgi:Ca2+-binding RTX toxin-like protein